MSCNLARNHLTRWWFDRGGPPTGPFSGGFGLGVSDRSSPLWRLPYVAFMVSRSLSWFGDNAWLVALGFAAATRTGAVTTGLVFAANGVPRLLLMAHAGGLADKFGPRIMMLVSDAWAAVTCVLVAVLVRNFGVTEAILIAGAFSLGLAETFFQPAAGAFVPQLVPSAYRSQAAAVSQMGMSGSVLIGSAVGGVLYGAGGLALAALVNAFTFAAIGVVVAVVRPRPIEHTGGDGVQDETLGSQVVAGLRYVRRSSLLLHLALFSAALNLTTMPIAQVGIALKAADNHWGGVGYGLIESAYAVGAIVGSIIAVRRPSAAPGKALLKWASAGSLPIVSLIFLGSLWACVVAVLLAGLLFSPAQAALVGLVQNHTPAPLMGRVTALMILISLGALPLGNVVFGSLAFTVGLTVTLALFALALCVAVVAFWGSKSIRQASNSATPVETVSP